MKRAFLFAAAAMIPMSIGQATSIFASTLSQFLHPSVVQTCTFLVGQLTRQCFDNVGEMRNAGVESHAQMGENQ
jgi:hypothetical protein